jgi:aminoglycoside phosphotransferase family enzyme/predicted kinase
LPLVPCHHKEALLRSYGAADPCHGGPAHSDRLRPRNGLRPGSAWTTGPRRDPWLICIKDPLSPRSILERDCEGVAQAVFRQSVACSGRGGVARFNALSENNDMDEQREALSFLSNPDSYGKPGTPIERIETHISVVFLVANCAYKLKRAVRFSYLDYSTMAQREKYLRAELTLNRRTAPALYRRLRAITREAGGQLTFDGSGRVIDWVLEMQRFYQNALFDRLADEGKLTRELVHELTDVISTFHNEAEITTGYGGRFGTEETIAGNNSNLIQASPPLDRGLVDELNAASMAKLSSVGDLLDRRRDHAMVRRCHGDLHLRNICVIDGRPTLFDCIEFSDALSCIDVLYDLAFLLMDLVQRDLREFASWVFNRYLDLTGDIEGLPALPLFMSMRAAIRAHVLAANYMQYHSTRELEHARSYLSLSSILLELYPPRLIAIGGLSGTGKSTVAQALACEFHPSPGARVIRSDVLRKRLFGLTPETRLPESAYGAATTERVYRDLDEQALASLLAGYTAIVDATFLRQEERKRISDVAARADVPFLGLWLEAPSEVLAARIGTRGRDASDADISVLQQQLEVDPGTMDWARVNVSDEMARNLGKIRALIEVITPQLGPFDANQ